jgi:protocatechuate 3,4-dioxygenase beta subunit
VLSGAGEYSVSVQSEAANSSTSLSFQVKVGSEAQQTHDFELPGAHISGRVVDRQGKPQAQVWLQLSPDSQVRGDSGRNVTGQVSTDDEGRFLFEHVSPGTYEIVLGGVDMGWRSGPRSGRTTRSGLLVEAGKSLEGLEIVAQPACRVEGTVTGPDGAPLAGANVMAVDEQGKSLTGWNRESTDASGHFDFDNLPPGRASFLAQKGSLTTGYSGWVTVQEREPAKVELALVQGTAVFVETTNAEGGAVRADVQVFDSRGLDVTGAGFRSAPTADAPPGRRIGPLAPGKYNLVVMRKDKPDLRQELSVAGEPTKAVLVRCD